MFFCEKCKTILVLDTKESSIFYNDNVTTIIDEEGGVDFTKLPDKIVYVCRRCGKTKVVDLNELVLKLKSNIVESLLFSRADYAFKHINTKEIDEANGISFCGMCRGSIDDSGYCYNDVIKQCPVRKKLYNEKHSTERDKYTK